MQKPSSVMPIAIALMAVAGIVFANVMAGKNTPKTSAQLEKEAQEEAEKHGTPAPTPLIGGAKGMAAAIPTDLKEANDLAALGPDVTLPGGEPGKAMTIGYEWTPELQADPSFLAGLVKKVKAVAPEAQIRLVNVDEKPETPGGISVNNKVVVPLGPDGNLGIAAADTAAAELMKAK